MALTVEKDYDRIASILVEAIYFGDTRTAERWDISTRTIVRYRERLDDNIELSNIVVHKKDVFEKDWAHQVPAAIRGALDFIVRCTQDMGTTKPENLHAVAGALKIVGEVELARQILNAKLHSLGYALSDRNTVRPLITSEAVEGEVEVEVE